ncbi:MAG: fused MFS/spermidine synthase [Caldilineaceae bacterium]|nr:fused MFS/spermidine synthase [Caldilineaceae bacterium]
MNETNWLTKNRQAIMERLQPWQAEPDGTLYAELHGVYFIIVTKAEGNLRLWLLDPQHPDSGVMQSEMQLADPLALFDDYTQAALLGLLWQPAPTRIYIAGLGGGCVPLVLHHHFPQATILCSEIEPAMIEMATRYFGLGVDERLHVNLADGRMLLAAQREPYDFIFLDVFLDRGYVPYRMSTVEFYTLCRERLSATGVLVINLLETDPYLEARVKSLQQVFPTIYVNPLPVGNILLYATTQATPAPETLVERAVALQEHHHFAFPFAVRSLDLSQDFTAIFPTLADAEPLFDDQPPPGYFDLLPVADTFFAPIEADSPCYCGSGLAFVDCHGVHHRVMDAAEVTPATDQ